MGQCTIKDATKEHALVEANGDCGQAQEDAHLDAQCQRVCHRSECPPASLISVDGQEECGHSEAVIEQTQQVYTMETLGEDQERKYIRRGLGLQSEIVPQSQPMTRTLASR